MAGFHWLLCPDYDSDHGFDDLPARFRGTLWPWTRFGDIVDGWRDG